ncbi:transcription factor [Ceratocystis pirilliformis]|uniref:Transcription factor n=1 Tax=Ceratocystis pirilliformis TaxID=259994 RepID=A0ABR3YHG2_9PEZI
MAPSSTTRSQRSRANSKREAAAPTISVSTAPDIETPSRPSKRRKKADDLPSQAAAPTDDDDENNDTHLTADTSTADEPDGDQLVSQIVQHLVCPKENPVQASKDHSNQIHESNKDGVKAYAKIAAQDWTFYVTKLEINIGRSSDASILTAAATTASDAPAPQSETTKPEDLVHIDLGPSKTVSRQHALIFFNSEAEQWYLNVKGRNGAKVDGSVLKLGTSKALKSGNVIEIGGVEMMFVLPSEISPLHIHDTFRRRAGLATVSRPPAVSTPARQLPSSSSLSLLHNPNLETPLPRSSSATARSVSRDLSHSSAQTLTFQQPIAPAPVDYRRPGTPTSSRNNLLATPRLGIPPSTPISGPSDIDLGLDENRHIKPQYSYAQMITQAIINTPDEKLNLNGIYNYITDQYAYYRHQPSAGWQNSIRHNLSLNKSFDKVARSTDEPGKGMKWQIVAEAREDMIRSAYRGGRGGHRGSSVPSSPSQLNYITHGPRDMAASRKRRLSPIHSPPSSGLTPAQSTPDRAGRRRGPLGSAVAVDGSPLPRPRQRKPVPSSAASYQTTPQSLSSLKEISQQNHQEQPTPAPPQDHSLPRQNEPPASSQQTLIAPRSPTLTSSYLQEDGSSFVTPAPPRVHPRLAPPSTVQRPSQYMPTSSPAPFWKYIDIGSTPLRAMLNFDSSPSRQPSGTVGAMGDSSPPRLGDNSPTKGRGPINATPSISVSKAVEDQETDHTKDAVAASAVVAAAVNGGGAPRASPSDEEETFDLAKGFQSIGSFHASAPPVLGRGLQLAPGQK